MQRHGQWSQSGALKYLGNMESQKRIKKKLLKGEGLNIMKSLITGRFKNLKGEIFRKSSSKIKLYV